MTAPTTGTLLALNVGRAAPIGQRLGQPVLSGIVKRPVPGRVRIAGVSVQGDEQADLSVHGGPDKAVYAYAAEDTAWWGTELGRDDLGPGTFGENLTVEGLDVSGAVIEERWRIGSALLEVSQPRLPCFKLGLRMGDPRFVKRFAAASRPGAYFRIIEEGEVGAGDQVEIVERPDAHCVTVAQVSAAIMLDKGPKAIRAVLEAKLPPELDDWLRSRAA